MSINWLRGAELSEIEKAKKELHNKYPFIYTKPYSDALDLALAKGIEIGKTKRLEPIAEAVVKHATVIAHEFKVIEDERNRIRKELIKELCKELLGESVLDDDWEKINRVVNKVCGKGEVKE